jgi:2-polyprenyl-3-methyl-5-hydroxy-6-metoxy-1,4-benzoquinol methylase
MRITEIRRRKRSGKLLEIGCGEGHLLMEAATVYDVTGTDISPYAVKRSRKLLGGRAVVTNAADFQVPVGDYDVVVAFNVLEHIPRPATVIGAAFSALRPSGVFVGSVPNNSGIVGRLVTQISNVFDRTHCSTYRPQMWRDHFRHAGFGQIDLFGEVSARNWHYVRGPLWKHVATNLVFVCTK